MALFKIGKKTEAPSCACGAGEKEGGACCGVGRDEEIRSVKVLGSGCKSCHALLENTKEAVKTLGLTVEVEYVTDMEKIMGYGVMSMPALVVNDRVAAMGKVLKPTEVAALLRKAEG